jgi:hypothetical protein
MASGATSAPQTKLLDPRLTGTWVAHPPKTNQLPRVRSEAAE